MARYINFFYPIIGSITSSTINSRLLNKKSVNKEIRKVNVLPKKRICDMCGRSITVQTRKGKKICTHCRSRWLDAEREGLTFDEAQPFIAESAKTAKNGVTGAKDKINWKAIKEKIETKSVIPVPAQQNALPARKDKPQANKDEKKMPLPEMISVSLFDKPALRAWWGSKDADYRAKVRLDFLDMLDDVRREESEQEKSSIRQLYLH